MDGDTLLTRTRVGSLGAGAGPADFRWLLGRVAFVAGAPDNLLADCLVLTMDKAETS
jgi:hypothetical protein